MKAFHPTVILLVLASVSSAGEWRIEAVDSSRCTFMYTSLIMDSFDYPHISYFNDTEKNLKYARWDGSSWRIETVDSTDNVGKFTSLALDSSDHPRISYYDDTNDDLKYASWDGAQWNLETVDSTDDVGKYTSLELDSSDYPHISYYDEFNGELKYARWDGAAWQIETVDSEGDVGSFSSSTLDSSDYPHISYCDTDNDYLKYARWDGSSWQIETVDTEGISYYISLALDDSDYPHISYCDYTNGNLKYAHWNGAAWQIETLDSGECCFSSLALDDSGYPHISYSDFDSRNLKYARWDGAEWQIETVDSEGDVGRYPSLALDSSDYPSIAYFDLTNHTLKFAWYSLYNFHLQKPEFAEDVETATPLLDWEDSPDPDLESYTLRWGTDYYFETYNEVTGIPESEYTILGGIEDGDRIYWRVKSVDEGGGENWAVEMDWYFYAELFHLLSPEKGDVVYAFPLTFDWQDQEIPGLESYTLWWGTDPDFLTYNEVTDIGESEYTITGGIEDGARVWWRVKSLDSEGGEYWAEELDWYFDVDLGGGIDLADFGAGSTDEGVLVNWRLSGGEPAGVRVLRGIGEPEMISGNLPGDSSRYLDRDVEAGGSYTYWLEVIDAEGVVSRFGPTEAVSVPEETFTLVLYAAYPSPSRDTVNLVYSLPADGRVVLSVYDLSGRRIATPVDSELTAGRHEVSWSCGDMPSGVYLYRLETSAGSLTERLVISR
ncbi:MAG TPA: T9SS type A sorting domain-containing protein [bacterium]|nr:T9SS type A sorting domain-containing protein [bacterium]